MTLARERFVAIISIMAMSTIAGCTDAQSTLAPEPSDAPSPPPQTTSADWAIFRGDAQLTGIARGTLPDDIRLRWTFAAEAAIVSSPVIVNGRVYVGSDDANLYAIDLATGDKIWAFKTEDIIEAPPLVHDGVVYIGSSDFFFYAIDQASGALRWKYETDDRVLGGANWVQTPDGVRIVVGSYDGNLYCFDPAGGDPRWVYETENYVNGTPAVVGTQVIFGGCDSALHIVDAITGEGVDRVLLCDECHIAGSVAVADGAVYFGHYGNAFICVDLEDASLRWSYTNPRFPFFSSPAISETRVVFGGRDKNLHCASRDDGTPLWTVPTRRKVDSSPVICGDKVVFGSGDGRLYVVSLENGDVLWSYEIGRSLFSSPGVAEGTIVIGSNDGQLYAFGAPLPDANEHPDTNAARTPGS